MKFVMGALAAVTLLVGVAASQPAEARCMWNGYGWQCFQPHHWWWHRDHVWHGGWHRGWDRGWDRDWR